MAPMTRCRASQPGNIPSAINAQYYQQRAGAGLILSEGTQVSDLARGYLWTPGIHSKEQVTGWRKVTRAVHAAGGSIACQLWHCGRISHSSLRALGEAPVGPSTKQSTSTCFALDDGGNPGRVLCQQPRALTTLECRGIIQEFADAARHAKRAGFDGVQIHGANGYLFDQFLHSIVNDRRDEYGGSIGNRSRLLVEAAEVAVEVWGRGLVGVRLSPQGSFNDMGNDPTWKQQHLHLAKALGAAGVAYLDLFNQGWAYGAPSWDESFAREMREAFGGATMLSGGLTSEQGTKLISTGVCDMVVFGRVFISNPDLVERFRLGAPLAEANQATFYGGGAEGYTDYPSKFPPKREVRS